MPSIHHKTMSNFSGKKNPLKSNFWAITIHFFSVTWATHARAGRGNVPILIVHKKTPRYEFFGLMTNKAVLHAILQQFATFSQNILRLLCCG